MKDLTNSIIDRKNILNNNPAIKEIYDQIGFEGVMFEGKYRYSKIQVAKYYEVEVRTIERLIENNESELKTSGYELFTDIKLKNFKDTLTKRSDINVGALTGVNSLSVFNFKAFLNVGMLLQTSEKAKDVRSIILNIVIDFFNKKLGGSTKYINQREEEFLPSAIREFNYRQEFTNALDHYIDSNKFKYSQLTDKIYISIFKEKSTEYRQILKLNSKDSVRSTMYSEVLDIISAYENGFAAELKDESLKLERKLKLSEANELFKEFEKSIENFSSPLKEKARSLMASRDMTFRDALHEELQDYVGVVSSEDFEKFLGEKSITLEERLKENIDVFKRLKDR